MRDPIPEADWKVFRQLRERALERFCERVLSEIERLRLDTAKSSHARYISIYRLIERRDKELARAFDSPRRSQLFLHLLHLRDLDLLQDDEYLRLSPGMRQAIDDFLGIGGGATSPSKNHKT
jgi:hypothetical protein